MREGLGATDDDAVLRSRRMRLDDLGIEILDNLELITQVEDLYLQRNKITSLPDMSCLTQLRFLALQYNQIEDLRPACLNHLRLLTFLDVSNNCISNLCREILPPSLVIFKFLNNPAASSLDVPSLISALPNLQEVNGTPTGRGVSLTVTADMRPGAGIPADSDQDRDFANELRDLQAGLGARNSSLHGAGVTSSAGLSTAGDETSERRKAIIDKYKASLQDSTTTLQDMERAVAQERSEGLQSLSSGLRSTRDAAVQRSHARSDAVALEQQAAIQAVRDDKKQDEASTTDEPVWKKVLAKFEGEGEA